jgi:nicotinamide phosphoribosyltransferase
MEDVTKTMILNSDSYKSSHFKQYPPETTHVSSYIEGRKNNSGIANIDGLTFFGLQTFLQELEQRRVTTEQVYFAESILKPHGVPFNRDGWLELVDKYSGRFPVMIETAYDEGSTVPISTPLVQIKNCDKDFFWLTSYLETSLLRAVWYPTTVATISRQIKRLLKRKLDETSDIPDIVLPFKLHDFGARGASSEQTAQLGGLAHLVNFLGTDTMGALVAARNCYYKFDNAGFSIPASEHSTITAWSAKREAEAYKNMIDQFAGEGKLYACVSDSYDLFGAVENIWGGSLKQDIKSAGGTLVIRPDSGVPVDVVRKTFRILAEKFAEDITVNSKGYRVLPPYLSVIQGDGVNYHSIDDITEMLIDEGWSTQNIAFGMGGALLQKVDRDTFGFAMKCNAVKFSNEIGWIAVKKDPKTDPGKASKAGRIDGMKTKFYDGSVISPISFDQVRKNAVVL